MSLAAEELNVYILIIYYDLMNYLGNITKCIDQKQKYIIPQKFYHQIWQ